MPPAQGGAVEHAVGVLQSVGLNQLHAGRPPAAAPVRSPQRQRQRIAIADRRTKHQRRHAVKVELSRGIEGVAIGERGPLRFDHVRPVVGLFLGPAEQSVVRFHPQAQAAADNVVDHRLHGRRRQTVVSHKVARSRPQRAQLGQQVRVRRSGGGVPGRELTGGPGRAKVRGIRRRAAPGRRRAQRIAPCVKKLRNGHQMLILMTRRPRCPLSRAMRPLSSAM